MLVNSSLHIEQIHLHRSIKALSVVTVWTIGSPALVRLNNISVFPAEYMGQIAGVIVSAYLMFGSKNITKDKKEWENAFINAVLLNVATLPVGK